MSGNDSELLGNYLKLSGNNSDVCITNESKEARPLQALPFRNRNHLTASQLLNSFHSRYLPIYLHPSESRSISPASAMAPPSSVQELIPIVINDAVLETILIQIRKLQQYQKRHLESPNCQQGIFTVRYIDDQIHLLNELFLQICSSLSPCVEGLSFNCNPVTVSATTAVSVDIEGTRRAAVVVEPAEPQGKPTYLSVA